MMKRLLGGLAAFGAFCVGCGSAETAQQAQEWVADGVVLLDVRTPGEHADGHIEGSLNIPIDELATRVDEVSGERVVVYCRSGGRSARAARLLSGAGKEVVDLGPMTSWPDSSQIVRSP